MISIWSSSVVKIPSDGEQGGAALQRSLGAREDTYQGPAGNNGWCKTKCDPAAEGKRLIHLKQI